MKTAFIFPGQGAQQVGMGKSLAETVPAAKEIFEKADIALGMNLARLCFEGPEEELRLTREYAARDSRHFNCRARLA